jgi:ABC-type amino acid transport substrate-binding protein
LKSLLRCLLITLLLLCMESPSYADSGHELRVGIFQMKPLNFTDEEGTPKGLYPDLLREIVHDEGWHLIFVPGSWGQCYDRLMNGEIDLITTVAYSKERAKVFDYNQEAVADIWGKVYTRSNVKITSMDGCYRT